MGKISAWGAVLVGLAFGAVCLVQVFQWGLGWSAATPGIVAALLLFGAFRTLRGMKGGLRLLAGAWGLAVGLLWTWPSHGADGSYSVSLDVGALIVAMQFACLTGLALSVVHQEK